MSKLSDGYDPGPQISHAGGINLGTQDIEKSLWFFRDILGMEEVEREGDVAYLRAYQELGHHSLVLRQQEESGVNSFSFRTKRPEDVELFYENLQRLEVEALEIPAGTETGRGTAVRFLLPGGEHPFELYYDMDKPEAPEHLRSRLPSNSSTRRGLGVRRLDHFNVQTSPSTINQAEKWMRDHLGFKRREFSNLPDSDTLLASWVSVTPQGHDIAIVANQEEKKGQSHHFAYNLESASDALTAADILRDLDVEYGWGPGKHGIGQATYLHVNDPGSGHRVELYAGGFLIFDEDWEAIEWKPVDFPDGLAWYGERANVNPGSPDLLTSGTAGLTNPLMLAKQSV
ncbi:catechol 1,2-dioxygenase [Glutamicibacter sp. BW80]|uniref:VOC family protein n=1 Tax=Glutamicibacter sp. BW80 TaxID=2024404 RepID=UPI000BB8DB46|nr:VOC family protein [Glutamicibacter sp. BW80]PCC30267.1 catechol 1,2-dioxygenase [Glutamicibacter sp. BW80]